MGTESWASGEEKEFSVFSISHSVSIDSKHGFSLGKTRRVIDFTDPGLTSAFPQVQPDREREGIRSGWTACSQKIILIHKGLNRAV